MKKNGYTFIEILAVLVILGLIITICTPIVVNVIEDAKERNRLDQLSTFAKQVGNAYMLTITNDNFYVFDSYEKGGVTTNNVITFTNEWIDKNVIVNKGSVNCKKETLENDTNTLSNVRFYINANKVELTNCTVGGISGYSYINGKPIKKDA